MSMNLVFIFALAIYGATAQSVCSGFNTVTSNNLNSLFGSVAPGGPLMVQNNPTRVSGNVGSAVLEDSCNGFKTIVKPQYRKEEIIVPSVQRFLQTSPSVVENVPCIRGISNNIPTLFSSTNAITSGIVNDQLCGPSSRTMTGIISRVQSPTFGSCLGANSGNNVVLSGTQNSGILGSVIRPASGNIGDILSGTQNLCLSTKTLDLTPGNIGGIFSKSSSDLSGNNGAIENFVSNNGFLENSVSSAPGNLLCSFPGSISGGFSVNSGTISCTGTKSGVENLVAAPTGILGSTCTRNIVPSGNLMSVTTGRIGPVLIDNGSFCGNSASSVLGNNELPMFNSENGNMAGLSNIRFVENGVTNGDLNNGCGCKVFV